MDQQESSGHGFSSRIADWTTAAALCRKWQDDGQKVVFTNGCFDILHKGHVAYLEEARGHGDRLVIGLNSDASTRRLKGPGRPINAEDARAAVLAALRSVDLVVIFDQDTPGQLIESLGPDVLIKGGDYRIDEIVGADFVRQRGGLVKTVPFLPGYSTSGIEDRIRRSPEG